MTYVFDSDALIDLFRHYYRSRFPSLWRAFDELVGDNKIISVKEVFREIESSGDSLSEWARENKSIFLPPAEREAIFVAEIFKVSHFRFLIKQQKILQGGPFADPFVIAKANEVNGIVVTKESYKANASKIPNVCKHFGVKCLNLEQFMEKENWQF